MHFIYVIINFLLLVAIVVLFGRKSIISIFRTRRERIDSELEEANKIEQTERPVFDVTPPELPAVDDSGLIKIQTETETKLKRIEDSANEECSELHREMVTGVKTEAIKLLTAKAAQMFAQEPYCSALRKKSVIWRK